MILVLILGSLAATPGEAAGPTTQDVSVPSFDGTFIAATLWTPEGPGPFPAILMTHGWGRDRSSLADEANDLTDWGYLVLTYDSRGFGGSGGVSTLDGPKEVRDVQALLDYLSGLNGVVQDAPRDPRVGMRGGSYGGAIQLLASRQDPRIDAIVPEITWWDLANALFPHDVAKLGWMTLLLGSGASAGHGVSDQRPDASGVEPALAAFYANAVATGRPDDATRAYLTARSPSFGDDNATAPTFLVQGWRDTLFTPNEAAGAFENLTRAQARVKLLFYSGGHGYDDLVPKVEKDDIEARVRTFLDHYLKDIGDENETLWPRIEWRNLDTQRWETSDAWPIRDAASAFFLHLDDAGAGRLADTTGPARRALVASGPAEGYSELPNFQPQSPLRSHETPVTSFAFESTALRSPLPLVGAPRLALYAGSTAENSSLFAKLYDVGPGGFPSLVNNQVLAFRAPRTDANLSRGGLLELELTAAQHVFEAGHKVRLVITSADAGYAPNRDAGAVGLFAGGATPSQLVLPLATGDHSAQGPPKFFEPPAPARRHGIPGVEFGAAALVLVLMASRFRRD